MSESLFEKDVMKAGNLFHKTSSEEIDSVSASRRTSCLSTRPKIRDSLYTVTEKKRPPPKHVKKNFMNGEC